MTEKETIKWLSRAYWLRIKIEKLQRQRDELESLAAGVRGTDYSKSPSHGGEPSTIADTVLGLVTMDQKIAGKVAEYTAAVDEITQTINSLDDERLSTLLYMRYVQGARMEKIACEMNYTYRHVKRLHRRGISVISKKMSPNVPLICDKV